MAKEYQQSPSQTVGPYFHFGLTLGGENILTNEQTLGERIVLKGRVLDGDGVAIPDAMVEIWQADSSGHFNHPADPEHDQADLNFRGFGRSHTVDNGYYFRTVKPGCIGENPVPYINVRIFSRGLLIHTVTRLYFSDHDNTQDPTFASLKPSRRQTLIAQRQQTPDGIQYRWDIRTQGEGETVFFDL